jgi:hypothetical protein
VGGYDIPGGWENLMTQYYDVMYCENYDWWTLAMAFNATEEQIAELYAYEFDGTDDLGIGISVSGKRVIITINCVIDGSFPDGDYYEDDEGSAFETDDDLLNLLTQVRAQLMDGDYRALYAVLEQYGDPDDENAPPEPEKRLSGGAVIKSFADMLGSL